MRVCVICPEIGDRGGTRLQLTRYQQEIATGVSAVTFAVQDRALDPFYREFDVFGQPSGESMPGDANRNGVVDDTDASILAANWMGSEKGWGDGDFNEDGLVNDIDATLMATNWTSAASAAVPEPSSAILLLAVALGLFAAMLRRTG